MIWSSQRFDRHGLHGRSALVSLAALSGHLLGLASNDWRVHARALLEFGLIDDREAQRGVCLWWYGRMIADSDMHLGNLSMAPKDGPLTVAPVYDMLPMACAPLPGGELRSPVDWWPGLPAPGEAGAWRHACAAALSFWCEVAQAVHLSPQMREIGRQHGARLLGLAERAV